ncbi:MAG TPA: four-carbon acid sugar kinase family protein [Hyphomicrobiaceae bacterium]|nr:four-carbon acid sugar kinase family protein [Hyphomicrobiaceae bacterium]
MLLGAVADDLTGATDLALMLTRAGMKTVQVMEVPRDPAIFRDFDAVVVALKTRTCPAKEAIELSLASAEALLAAGARQIFFKYCSTFDSTDEGNIGPVADALADRLGADLAIACPAFPTNKRTIYMGHLFVGELLLSDSPMKDHPLTPMRDASLVRVLGRQTQRKVGLVKFDTVRRGADAIRSDFKAAIARGERYVIVDALTDDDLMAIGRACRDMKLITGGSGVALGLPQNFVEDGSMVAKPSPSTMQAAAGRAAILAGSCSEATRGQVASAITAGIPAFKVDPAGIVAGRFTADGIVNWATQHGADGPVLVYSSADPMDVRAAQASLGREKAGHVVEQLLAEVARRLVAGGVTRLLVAGGETSGAVVQGLGVTTLEIGPEIDPGVPWTRAVGRDLVLALKSGNFGTPDFFIKAWGRLS